MARCRKPLNQGISDVNKTALLLSNTDLKPGDVLQKDNPVYQYQMILSDKRIVFEGEVFREVCAWNDNHCRRMDISESELKTQKVIASLSAEQLEDYINKNKKNEWAEAKRPEVNL